ncbi:MAG: MlaD family protein [Alphaproteobacteria bacterium]
METKANHLAVGTFVLVAIVGLFAFALWLGKAEIDREFDRYYIYFSGTVSGLTTASTVRYRGVPVGTISEIRIDPENSERVRVTVEVTRGTPIKEDAVATLELQGITGLVDIEIKGGSRDSPSLEPQLGEKIAVIASTPSKLEALFEDVPQAVNRFTYLIERGALLLSDENLAAINGTLENLKTLTDTLAASTDEIETLTGEATIAVSEIRRTTEGVSALVQDLRERLPGLVDNASTALNAMQGNAETLTEDAQATLHEFRESARTLNGAADELDKMLAENRPAFRDFSRDGLYELSRFLVEARVLVASMTRIADRFEADPARFLFGDSEAGFEPQ